MTTTKIDNVKLKGLLDIHAQYLCKLLKVYSLNGIDYESQPTFRSTLKECKILMVHLNHYGVETSQYDFLNHFPEDELIMRDIRAFF